MMREFLQYDRRCTILYVEEMMVDVDAENLKLMVWSASSSDLRGVV